MLMETLCVENGSLDPGSAPHDSSDLQRLGFSVHWCELSSVHWEVHLRSASEAAWSDGCIALCRALGSLTPYSGKDLLLKSSFIASLKLLVDIGAKPSGLESGHLENSSPSNPIQISFILEAHLWSLLEALLWNWCQNVWYSVRLLQELKMLKSCTNLLCSTRWCGQA